MLDGDTLRQLFTLRGTNRARNENRNTCNHIGPRPRRRRAVCPSTHGRAHRRAQQRKPARPAYLRELHPRHHPRPEDGRHRPPAMARRPHQQERLGLRARRPARRHGRRVARHRQRRRLRLHQGRRRPIRHRRRHHHRLQSRRPHPRRHRDGPRRPARLPRHPAGQVRQGREVPPRPARRPAPHRQRRLLAQADLPQPDVARRRLHGRALPRRVRRHLPAAPRTSTTSPNSSSSWTTTCATPAPACSATAGTSPSPCPGPTRPPASARRSGPAPWAGTAWPWSMSSTGSPLDHPAAPRSHRRAQPQPWPPSSRCRTPTPASGGRSWTARPHGPHGSSPTAASASASSTRRRQLPRSLRQLHVHLRPRQGRPHGLPPAVRRSPTPSAPGPASRSSSSPPTPTAPSPSTAPSRSAASAAHPTAPATFDYYIHEPVVDQDNKGVGAFLLAGSEMEQIARSTPQPPASQLKDFHATSRPTKSPPSSTPGSTRRPARTALGQTELYHYKWDDDSDNGYSFFGRAFQRYGVHLATAPRRAHPRQPRPRADLRHRLTRHPHQKPQPALHGQSQRRRHRGLGPRRRRPPALLQRPRQHRVHPLQHPRDRFGIHFNPVLSHHVVDPDHSTGEVVIPPGTGIFGTGFTAYMKDTSTITATGPAKALVTATATS